MDGCVADRKRTLERSPDRLLLFDRRNLQDGRESIAKPFLDPQPLDAVPLPLPTPDLRRRVLSLAPRYDHVVIDTPPSQLAIVRAAMEAAKPKV